MMKKVIIGIAVVGLVGIVIWGSGKTARRAGQVSGAPPYGEAEENVPQTELPWFSSWKRPEGPPKVGLQVGHWRLEELPEELERLRANTGSSGGGKSEWEANLKIANGAATVLRSKGVEVEIIPATIPPGFWADAFVAIHADGSLDRSKTGYKVAAPWRDFRGQSRRLAEALTEEYGITTGLEIDPNITRNMRGYYAFSWWRYEHAIHPMAAAAIIETGFLTSPTDRKLIVDNAGTSAEGIARGIGKFLTEQGLTLSQ